MKREKELNVTSKDCDPYVDAYLKANAAATPDDIATEAGHCFADLCAVHHSTACALLYNTLQHRCQL